MDCSEITPLNTALPRIVAPGFRGGNLVEDDVTKTIVIGQNTWYKGTTEHDAIIRALVENIHSDDELRLLVYEVSDDAYVNEMGGVNYANDGGFANLLQKIIIPAGERDIVKKFAIWFDRNIEDSQSPWITLVQKCNTCGTKNDYEPWPEQNVCPVCFA